MDRLREALEPNDVAAGQGVLTGRRSDSGRRELGLPRLTGDSQGARIRSCEFRTLDGGTDSGLEGMEVSYVQLAQETILERIRSGVSEGCPSGRCPPV